MINHEESSISEVYEISKISFGILSPEEILKMAANCNVTGVKVADRGENIYSKYMGTIENGEMCKTCYKDVWLCQGHFGYFKLEHPVVNPIFVNDAANVLKCLCFSCYRFLLSPDHLRVEGLLKRFSEILLWIKNIKHCVHCGAEKLGLSVVNETIVNENKSPIDTYKILRVLENMSDETVEFLGFNPNMAHPKNYVFTVFPVLPPCCRPYVTSDENCCDDDLTYQLIEIIKNNQYLSEAHLSKTEQKRSKSVLQSSAFPTLDEVQHKFATNLKFRVSTYYNNSKKKAKHANNAKPITGLKERIAGKEGQIRNHILGKRTDQSGRSVISPDSTLKLDELMVPADMARVLTIPEYATRFNVDFLTQVVNRGEANFLIRAADPLRSINLNNALNYRGTLLHFGDIIVRGEQRITIQDTKFLLREGDAILRKNKFLPNVQYPAPSPISVEIGDLVKRHVRDGDYVLLNRQPTLHKASMMAFKAVVREGKTIRMNLAATKPFNADFDGDEMNLHVPQSYEATAELRELCSTPKSIMSFQNGRPNMAIVQDALIGAHLLSKDTWTETFMSSETFSDIIAEFMSPDLDPKARLEHIQAVARLAAPPRTGLAILSFLFPIDFTYTHNNIVIQSGVWMKGTMNKETTSLLIKILYKDYGERVVSDFINNIQFGANKYLIDIGFTINATDCLKGKVVGKEIQTITAESFVKAASAKSTTKNVHIQEQKVLNVLSSCADQSMRKSKDVLDARNSFRTTVESGSKGSAFNICQITSLLGQQTIDGKRVAALLHPQDNEFKSRGFIERSFVEGLEPREFLHHAMAGRKGVIDTALLTSVSGYGQRQGVKLNENIKICYDHTVRDNNGRLYQFVFGDVGYDPSQTIVVDGVATIANIYRMVDRMKLRLLESCEPESCLTATEIEQLVDYIKPRLHIPVDVETRICELRRAPIERQLRKISLQKSLLPELRERLEKAYYSTLMSPGECVGIIGAQSIGEFSTQATLNTFHVAGSNSTGVVTSCLTRFQEINNATKTPRHVVGKIYFTRSNQTIEEIRTIAGSRIKHVCLKDLVLRSEIRPYQKEIWYSLFRRVYGVKIPKTPVIRLYIDLDAIYATQLHPEAIKEALERDHDVVVVFSPLNLPGELRVDLFCPAEEDLSALYAELKSIRVAGLVGVKNIYFAKDDIQHVWYVQTEGGLLKDFYTLEGVDIFQTTTNNVWDIFHTLGIEAAREFRIKEMVDIVGSGVDISHIKLRSDRLTFSGTVQSLTRYTMRSEKPLSKVGFEEIMENFYKTARDAEIDDLTGVSAAIMCGKRAKVGTGMCGLAVDFDKILKQSQTEEEDADGLRRGCGALEPAEAHSAELENYYDFQYFD